LARTGKSLLLASEGLRILPGPHVDTPCVRRVIALKNDLTQFEMWLKERASDMIVNWHQANGMLLSASFEKPDMREAHLSYLGETYHEIRNEGDV
jgi:hypothetical protein